MNIKSGKSKSKYILLENTRTYLLRKTTNRPYDYLYGRFFYPYLLVDYS